MPEEIAKVGLIAAVALESRDFDEPMDGVVYGAAVGLGFAAVEISRPATQNANLVAVAVMRGVLSVPFHGALGAIAGAYIAGARFGGALGAHRHGGWWRARRFAWAWLLPVVLHTLFDWSVFSLGALGRQSAYYSFRRYRRFDFVDPRHLARRRVWDNRAGRLVGAADRASAKGLPGHQGLPPAHWRLIWGRTLCGVGFSIVGIALIVAGALTAKVLGFVGLAIAIAISAHCAKYLSDAAKATHRLVAAERIASS